LKVETDLKIGQDLESRSRSCWVMLIKMYGSKMFCNFYESRNQDWQILISLETLHCSQKSDLTVLTFLTSVLTVKKKLTVSNVALNSRYMISWDQDLSREDWHHEQNQKSRSRFICFREHLYGTFWIYFVFIWENNGWIKSGLQKCIMSCFVSF